MKFTAKQIKNWNTDCELPSGKVVPARPLSFGGLYEVKQRIKLAFYVMTGRYDALDWEDTE